MKTNLVSIGNSIGIRIPQVLLRLCHMGKEVDMQVKRNTIIIKPMPKKTRDGWEESFRLMHEAKDDQVMIDDSLDLHMENWEW